MMTPEQRRQRDADICEAFRNGSSRLELTTRFGLNDVTIFRTLKSGGLLTTPEQRRQRDAAICEAFRKGPALSEIAIQFKISETTVWRTLNTAGLVEANPMSSRKSKRVERDAAIRELHGFGLTAQDIAFEFDISLSLAYQALERLGIKANARPNLDADIALRNEAICEAFRNGSKHHDLAKRFNLNYATIYRALKSGGLTMTPEQHAGRKAERDADICEAFRSGLSRYELMKRFDLPYATVRRVLANAGYRRATLEPVLRLNPGISTAGKSGSRERPVVCAAVSLTVGQKPSSVRY